MSNVSAISPGAVATDRMTTGDAGSGGLPAVQRTGIRGGR